MSRRRDALQKTGEIVGHVIHVRGVAAFHFPGFAQHFTRAFRHHQNGGHAERMRHGEIARQILEHRGALRVDTVSFEEFVVGLRQRLRLEIGRDDVEHVLEFFMDFEPPRHGLGVLAVILFGLPEKKDEVATGAWADDGIVQQAARAIKHEVPGMVVIGDVTGRGAEAAAQTGRDVGNYVLLMVIADETDEAAMAKPPWPNGSTTTKAPISMR